MIEVTNVMKNIEYTHFLIAAQNNIWPISHVTAINRFTENHLDERQRNNHFVATQKFSFLFFICKIVFLLHFSFVPIVLILS